MLELEPRTSNSKALSPSPKNAGVSQAVQPSLEPELRIWSRSPANTLEFLLHKTRNHSSWSEA